MTRHLMTQWRGPQWRAEEAQGRSGMPLKHTASDAEQFARLEPGDRVYVVGQRDRRMILIGRMNAGSVMSQAEADAYFAGEDVYEADYHVIASECSTCRFDRVVPESVVRALVSERGAGVALVSNRSYELQPSALQPRLWLTEASARALDRVLEDDPPLSDEARELVAEVENRRGGGQGRRLSADERKAVERRAMAVAIEHFRRDGWTVDDVSAARPYDLERRRGGHTRPIEVKGTTEPTIGEVLVTANEAALAQSQRVDYAVVTAIILTRGGSRPAGSGGTVTIFEDLTPGRGDLIPLAYSLRLPHQAG